MKSTVSFVLLLATTISSCSTSQTEDNNSSARLSFQFKIETISPNSYRYNSETGKLEKLIDPFLENELYADTTLILSTKQLDTVLVLCQSANVFDYAHEFKPKQKIGTIPEPGYLLEFKIGGKTKTIEWMQNTSNAQTVEAQNLSSIISVIDHFIVTSPEFKALPEQQYSWQ